MNSTPHGESRGWIIAAWGLLGVLAVVLLWNVLGERSDSDALSEVTDEVLEPEIPIHRTSSPLPMARDTKTSNVRAPAMEDYVVADRLSGRNVGWREARWRRMGSQPPVPVVLKPVGANSLKLSPQRAMDLRSGLATLEIRGSDKFGEDIWAGTIDAEENIVWVDAFAELRVHVDATQLSEEYETGRLTLEVMARPRVPEGFEFRRRIHRAAMMNRRLAPESFREWARGKGWLKRDFAEKRRVKVDPPGEWEGPFFIPCDVDVWVLVPGTDAWSPIVLVAAPRRGTVTRKTVRLSPPKRIQGKLFALNGRPLAGASVWCKVTTEVPDSEFGFPYTERDADTSFGAMRAEGSNASIVKLAKRVSTDRAGRFTATFPITDTVVCYCIRGEGSAVKVVELGSRDAEPPFITLRLSAKPSHLRLLDGKGNPLANTSIKFVDTEPRVRLQINYPPVNTDADGWLEGAHFLEPGVRYWIHPTGKMRLKQTFTYQRGTTVVLPD